MKRFYRLLVPGSLARIALTSGFLINFFFLNASVFDTKSNEENKNPILPPVAICKNISVQLGSGGSATITGSDVDAGSYDPDGTITSRTVVPNTFTCIQKGINNVVLTVTDNEGLTSSCNATVTVEDKIPPVMICRNITLYLDVAGKATISPGDINNGSYDNCPAGLTFYLSRTDFTCADVGSPVNISLIGTDASGNSASCTSTITVLDNVPPVVNLKPFNLVLGASGTATLLPANVDNGSFDNCGSVALSVSPVNFSCSDLGQKTVTLTATDSNGNSTSRDGTISVSTTLNITGMSVSSCDLAPTFALYESDVEGGDGNYSYFWRGLDPASLPFMVIIPFPPTLQFFNSSTAQSPFYNNTMPDGYYNIRLMVTDGNGCIDSSDITLNKTGAAFNNQTIRYSEACEGEVKTYTVDYKPNATYGWSVTNGTILSSITDTNKVTIRWNLGVIEGRVLTTLIQSNPLFPGGLCSATVVDTVTINPVLTPVLNSPVTSVCSNSVVTYTLTSSYPFQQWSVSGGLITAGGSVTDNFVTVIWGTGPAGSVSVSVGNDAVCTGSIILNVSIFNLSGTITSLTDISCNGGSNGSVTVAATTGTGVAPYSYSLDGGAYQPGGTFTNLSLGNHIVRIRDALLCTFDLPFVINQPPPLTGSITGLINVSCFGGSDGSVTINATGGTPPYQYRLNAGAYQGSNIFSGLTAGSYIVTVQDSRGCTGSLPVAITQPPTPLNGFATVTNVSCSGESTGRIDLTVNGGTQPYSFVWSNGTTTEDIINIPAGSYSVIITDANGCTFTVSTTITQPASPLSGTVSIVNVLCFGGTNGSINLTVAGGTPPYSFAWSNGALTEDLLNLPAGSYSVLITDANGCTTTVNAVVTQPAAPLSGSIVSQSNVSCFGGNNGTVTVAGTDGTSPYEYQLGAGPFQPSGTFGSLTVGIYNIIIRDVNLCTFVLPVTITGPAAPLSGAVVSKSDVLCFGNSTGSVTVAGSGGTSPYEYNIDGGVFQASGTFGTLTAGIHNITVRDNNLCTFSLSVTILQPLSAVGGSIVSQTNVGCFGASTGSVAVAGSGGVPPYTYSIDGGAFQPSGIFSNLTAGVHSVTIRDFNLCEFIVPVTISQPLSALSVTVSHTDVLCLGGATGTATATPSGGTSPYTYLWNTVPPSTSSSISGLTAGTYTVTVTDNNGCTTSGNAAILQPAAAITATASVTNVSCNGGNNGTINLTVANGVAPLTFLWSNGATTEDISGLAAGVYTVTVTDANGCNANASATVTQPAVLAGSIVVIDVACFGGNSGSINLTISGGTQPYTFIWSNGAVTEDINNIPSGNYSVSITDANGCALIINGVVNQPASALNGSITSQTDVSVYGGNDGSVTVAGSGGTPPYQYSINGGGSYQASGTFSSLSAGNYSVIVRDSKLCIYSIPVTINQPWVPLEARITAQTNVSCKGGTNGSVTVTGWGGTPPYVYSIDGGPFLPSGTFSSLAPGTYTLAVRDAIPDQASISVTITEPPALNVAVSGEDIHCYGTSTGSVTATPTGGTGPFTYSWNTVPVQTTQTATGLPAGTYSVLVTDANGCNSSNTVTIMQPAIDLTLALSHTDVLCFGEKTGSATAVVTGGLAPYNYSWSTTPVQTKETATDLGTGIYTVRVTDSYGCEKTGSVTITEPQAISVESTTDNASCPDSKDGSITLTISGGTAPYTIRWSDDITTQNRTNVAAGTYTAEIRDINNCTKSVTVEVDYNWSTGCLEIPQVITPNNDGYNDEWRIRNIDRYPNAEVKIFNRWGQLVFSTKNLADNPWDGRKDGKIVPTDSYHYILYLGDGSEPRSGVISVIR